MLPPSWKGEVQEAVEEATNTDSEQRKARQSNAAAKIAASIDALRYAQEIQTSHEDQNENINIGLAVTTIFLVFLTVIFTGLSWCAFREQLHEMQASGEQTKKIIEAANQQAAAANESAKTTRDAYVASQRAWVGPSNAKIDGEIAIGKALKIVVDYLNTGREPALNFIYTIDALTSTLDDEKNGITMAKINAAFTACRESQVINGGSVVFPSTGGINPSGQAVTITTNDSFVDQDIVDGNNIAVVDGCFVYKSIGIVRHSYFCYFYRAKQSQVAI